MTRGVVIGPMAAVWHPLSGDASRDRKRHECAVQLELMTGISDFSFGAVKCIRLKNVSAGGNRTEVLWNFISALYHLSYSRCVELDLYMKAM